MEGGALIPLGESSRGFVSATGVNVFVCEEPC